jgi:hypothetical protein
LNEEIRLESDVFLCQIRADAEVRVLIITRSESMLRWRRIGGGQLLPLVRAGVKFADDVQVDPAKHATHSN